MESKKTKKSKKKGKPSHHNNHNPKPNTGGGGAGGKMAEKEKKTSEKKNGGRPRVVIVPGNGCYPVDDSNWYSSVEKALKDKGYDVALENMPDPNRARESIWLPFIEEKLKADANTILVGHSSGAEAGMRYAETRKLKGLVLVSACYTDLGVENERQAGYYNRPWQWNKIKENCEFIVQFASNNDPFIPEKEMLHVAKNLESEYHCLKGRGHFLGWQMAEVTDIILEKTAADAEEEE
mmetsp:Transcript_32922/g.61233  ORF Transcript_32922/g.61233 Transcript_32922/m.61233 type:complete len:237 (-) Transcript_32922:338-1048(-)